MKSAREMTDSLLERREEYLAVQARRQRTVRRVAGSALGLGLAVLVGFGVWSAVKGDKQPQQVFSGAIVGEDSPARPGGPAAAGESVPIFNGANVGEDTADAVKRVIWNDPAADSAPTGDEEFAVWEGKTVGHALLDALNKGPADAIYAVRIRPAVDGSFIWRDKTLAQYDAERQEERDMPEKLAQLLKDGDALKYGTALYETGTPDQGRWAQSAYEERVAFYGTELLSRYIVGGEFLKDRLEADLITAQKEQTAALTYEKALYVWLDSLAASLESELPPQILPEERALLVFFTAQQLKDFRAPGMDERWTFTLAAKESDDE